MPINEKIRRLIVEKNRTGRLGRLALTFSKLMPIEKNTTALKSSLIITPVVNIR